MLPTGKSHRRKCPEMLHATGPCQHTFMGEMCMQVSQCCLVCLHFKSFQHCSIIMHRLLYSIEKSGTPAACVFGCICSNTNSNCQHYHVCSSVGLSAWKNSASTGQIFIKFDIVGFFKNLSRKFKCHQNLIRKMGGFL
jgi:hypothetical protein